ncbi:uromodulin-like [Arapaima gigas]
MSIYRCRVEGGGLNVSSAHLADFSCGTLTCPSDSRLVTIVENRESFQARFSALLLMFEENGTYLYCSLTVYDKQESTCTHVCSVQPCYLSSPSKHETEEHKELLRR